MQHVPAVGVLTIVFGRTDAFSSPITDFVGSANGFQIDIVSFDPDGANTSFTQQIVALGDVNGDGFGDLMISTQNNSYGFFDGDWSTNQYSFLFFGGAEPSDLPMGELPPRPRRANQPRRLCDHP